ncbi:hypothetical protein G7Y89_g3936 [Cudoniella acicularis]|uniref:Uncharacterized protein n=1 Tax=Cudoniella acicularis TaxID=354080 RepID=A0A8H4RQE8_9HELO|nr:hypothetical protein G7Y89_g3936 [Cudoniella acicularis]
MRDENIIPKDVRFQVSLPPPTNVINANIDPAYQTFVEPRYISAFLTTLRRIQDNIPATDLTIQFDLASEFAYLEGVATDPLKWILPLKGGLLDRVVNVACAVDAEVELGFHFCYGDFQHKHFKEPKDMETLVDFANEVLSRVRVLRPVTWIHMPVPKNRTDRAYFAALKDLKIGDTEIYLGLLHKDDLNGTRKRIAPAQKFVPLFGISTECGLGRADEAELESVLNIAKEVLT